MIWNILKANGELERLTAELKAAQEQATKLAEDLKALTDTNATMAESLEAITKERDAIRGANEELAALVKRLMATKAEADQEAVKKAAAAEAVKIVASQGASPLPLKTESKEKPLTVTEKCRMARQGRAV